MTHPSTKPLIWSQGGRTLLGGGEQLRIDPGTGPGRYERALGSLRDSDNDMAFASFTFDSSVSESVVIVPEHLTETTKELEITATDHPRPSGVIESDGISSWRKGFKRALDAIDQGTVEKVVLTRQIELRLESDASPADVSSQLEHTQKGCYIFAVDGLVGASPELLVSLRDGVVSSLVLAGTAPNAESLSSAKMDLEHVLAATSVHKEIAQHVTVLDAPRRSVLEFGEIKHLATRFEGPVANGSTVLDVVGALHPTASVAGTPTEASLNLIREIEPVSRGRYAGPVGWFNSDGEGEFAIALRCGLLEGKRVTLYTGGGLVEGSDESSEHAETELKLNPMLRALGLK